MKTKSVIFLVLIFASTVANALCINCGCQRAYRSCVDSVNANAADSNPFNDYISISDCKDMRRDCHGQGITIQL